MSPRYARARQLLSELARDEIATDAIELPAERTKSGLAHTIPITPMIRRVLDTLPKCGKFVRGRSTIFAAASQADYSGSASLRISSS
jgi:hypothetical protein